jgi:hypothetical protein
MGWSLPITLVASVFALCAHGAPAPQATSGASGYVDTVQSIQCVGDDRIQLTFQNAYSFSDAWNWGCTSLRTELS